MKKKLLVAFMGFCLLSQMLVSMPCAGETAPTTATTTAPAGSAAAARLDHTDGFVWLSGGSGSSNQNSTYGRNYRDLGNAVNIARLDLRYFNDKAIEYHVLGNDLGTRNSRLYGVLYLQDRFKLDFDGGMIDHTISRPEDIRTRRNWLELAALQDVSPFVSLGLSVEGYDRNGATRFNPVEMSYTQVGLSLNYLRGSASGQIFYRGGNFKHSLYGHDDSEFGVTLGHRFRSDRDHALVSFERNHLQNDAQSALEIDRQNFSAVYSATPHKHWTFRGSFRNNDTDNDAPSIFAEDISDRFASLDVMYDGFHDVRVKGRVSTRRIDREARVGHNLLPDTKDVTTEIRLADKGRCEWKWDFHYKYTDRDGGLFTHLDPINHARSNAFNYMDYFPGNSYKRSLTSLAVSKDLKKDKVLLYLNLLRDRTEYTRSFGVGLNDMEYSNVMANIVWFANRKLTLGLGGGTTETDMNAATNVWYQYLPRTYTSDYDGWDKVYNFNLGYNFSSRTTFTADFLTTQSNSDGLLNPNRFKEFEQRYDLDYRLTKNARLALRFTDVWYAERIFTAEDGRVRRFDLDYRISF